NDPSYDTLLIDRFFRIISQAKQLLFLGTNSSFTLTLTVLKMLEAMKIQEIDLAIENLQKISQNSTQVSLESNEASTPQVTDKAPDKKSSQHSQFQFLIEKIYERNFDLGQCFENNISFISFEDSLLVWESQAKGADKERLKNSYSIIKNLVLEIFGMQTQIKPLYKEETQAKPDENTQTNQESKQIQTPSLTPHAKQSPKHPSPNLSPSNLPQQPVEQPAAKHPQPSPSHTISNAESEVQEALQTPLLKSVKELLSITQVKVRQKENP
ncbi:MAG: DNA polymerase III subunit gamma/tau, partial [Helicobacter sp.]|nr:DNA polymerase III subunit gamma/tau [Helicobacter sp.]